MTGWFVPGRIEVLGKHTDYGGGRVLVCAVDRGVTVTAEPANGPAGRVTASTTAFPAEAVLDAGTAPHLPPGHWGHYVQTVIDRLAANFGELVPARLSITSDLPQASGMSSSSALLSAVALALADLSGLPGTPAWSDAISDRMSLAGYAASIENGKAFGPLAGSGGVGTSGGSLDHTGMLTSEAGRITYAEFDPPRILDRVGLPDEYALVVAVSGVLAEKTGGAREAYNRGPASLAATTAAWNAATGRSDATPHAILRSLVGDDLDAPLRSDDPRLDTLRAIPARGYDSDRLTQFIEESAVIVPAARDALAAGDVEAFARLVDVSQGLAATHLRNQVRETAALVELAHELGAVTASAFGAGFGGSVWALVPAARAEDFAEAWLEHYRVRCAPAPGASAFVTRPSAAGHRLPA
ncbi:galactokinase family protein [Brachybacterium huguangmaarense]